MSYSAFQESVVSGNGSNTDALNYSLGVSLETRLAQAAAEARLDATRNALAIVTSAADLTCARAVLEALVRTLEVCCNSV